MTNADKRSGKKRRDLEKSRKEILHIAFEQIFAHGFQGVSADDIVKETSLTKGAFYHHFPTKLDLGYALVEEVIEPMILERWLRPLEAEPNPLDGILRQIKTLIDPHHPSIRLGCPLNNLIQEMAPIDRGFHRRLEKALSLWIDGIETHLKRARKNGLLKKDVNTRQVAHFIVMSHEGFYGILKGLDAPKAFKFLYGALHDYFETLRA